MQLFFESESRVGGPSKVIINLKKGLKLIGEEFSIHTITDGINSSHTFPIKDYKRLLNNNKGCNTGSMGCISGNLHFLTDNDITIAKKVNQEILKILNIYAW